MQIEIIRADDPQQPQQLEQLNVTTWSIWEKEASRFSWFYDSKEICYLLKGNVTVTPENGNAVTFGSGDLITFPAGMRCTWEIHEDVKKHYQFF